MENFIPHHRQLAAEKLKWLRSQFPPQPTDVQQKLQRGYYSIKQAKELGFRCMNGNLPMAVLVWEALLPRLTDREERRFVLDQLFHARTAVGPWNSALQVAVTLLDELEAWQRSSIDSSGGSAMQSFMFHGQLNLGTAYRLLKDLSKAEYHYREALHIAQSQRDFDCEVLAKVHLAMCILDKGQLKEAIDKFFKPLLASKNQMQPLARTLYLQCYGNACRSAADWGAAKDYLRESINIAKQLREPHLVSLLASCCGDLGNVFRSEGRYKDAEFCHLNHYDLALKRGDVHGVAVACGNIGFLKYYDPTEREASVVFQAIECSLAEQVGDTARMGIACNKIGKLYTVLGHFEEAVKLFLVAVHGAQQAQNVAGEGMAWGNLGTVYRTLGKLDEAIKCHVIYRENASKRLDVGGVAIMQHQLALDFLLKGDLPEAERSILDCFQTLEKIRSQLGDEDESKISNFEKNQAEAHNLLQVVLTAQGRYKEAFVFSDRSRTRALAEIIQTRLSSSEPESEQTRRPQCNDDFDPDASRTSTGSLRLNPANVEEYFEKAVTLSKKLASTLITYSIVKEFYAADKSEEWVYTWVLPPSGDLHFSKSRLDESLTSTEVQRDEQCVFSPRSVHGGSSQLQQALRSIRSKRAAPVAVTTSLLPVYSLHADLEGVEDLLSCDDVLTEPHHDCAEETSTSPKVPLDPAEPETGDKEASFEGSSPEEATISQESDLGKGENTSSSESDVISCPSKTGANVSEKPLEKSAESEHSSSIDDHTDPTTEISSAESAEGSDVGDESFPSEKKVGDSAQEVGMNKNSGEEEWKPLLKSTYRVLIEPILEHISSGALEDSPRVTFIPQDFLLRVPFAALYEERSDSYLVDKFVISTSPSVHLLDLTVEYLNRLQNGTTADNLSLLAIGNPLMPFEELPPLPAAEEEVCAIAEILSGSSNEIALEAQATKNHVTSVMSNFRILHFATHAAVDVSDAHGDFTHRGFIVLAKSDEQCNGFLTAEEVRRMKLNAELVVLSCCDSGLGKVTGEGVLGLSRAFLAAGAACVVVTLWKINDDCTALLMRHFYQEYKESRDAAVALHKAMRSVRGSGASSPEQWAAFSIIGATGKASL